MTNALNKTIRQILWIVLGGLLVIGTCFFSLIKRIEPVHAENNYTNIPIMTIVTHGLGGSPVDWSNDGAHIDDEDGGLNATEKALANIKYSDSHYIDYNFKYQSGSLIEQLRQKNANSLVYIVSAHENTPYIDKFTPDPESPTGYSAQAVSANDMDFSKHSIIVYNASGTEKDFVSYGGEGYNNDFDINYLLKNDNTVVGDFFRTIDYVVEDLYRDNATNTSHLLPKINLIGHSQGTIVNLLYATKHPDMIDSMFALGGLFNGSDIAQFAYSCGLEDEIASIIGSFFCCDFVSHMADSSYTNAMKTRWNNVVAGKNIKGYGIASGFDISFLKKFITDDPYFPMLLQIIFNEQGITLTENHIKIIKDASVATITALQYAARYGLTGNAVGMAYLTLLEKIYNITDFSAEQRTTFGAAIDDMVSLITGNPVLNFDGFLEESTQAAFGYDNFTRYYRVFSEDTSFAHRSQGNLGFPHNLETQDSKIINYICSNITMGSPATFAVKNGSIKRVNRVDGALNSLTIPSVYDSQTITSLDKDSFAENLYGNTQITSITIPATVTEIGMGAFQNCTNLTSVTFAPGSQLTTIYAYAFAGCANLTSIDLPNSVTTIYEYAFADTGLTSCNLKNVSSLGYGVFSECHALTSFSKNSGNGSLMIESGKVVYGYSSTQLLAYACGNTGTSFTIPNSVTIIGEGAFKGANHLTSIGFPSSLSEVRFSAFENCTGLTNIVLPGTVTDIGAFAFCGCYNLTSVRMFSTGNIAIGMGAFTGTDAVSFTVPQARINYYKQTEGLSPYATQVTAITYQISYVTYNGQTIAPTNAYYGEIPTIFSKNDLTPRTGYAIDGWYLSTSGDNGAGTAFNAAAPYLTKNSTVLYAKWNVMNPGNIHFDGNADPDEVTGTMDNGNVEYNGSYTIPTCTFSRPGYEYSGWATSPNGNVVYQSGHTYTFTLVGEMTLYVKWTPITYSIVYDYNGGTEGINNLQHTYTVANPYVFPSIGKEDSTFYGWMLIGDIDGAVLESTAGYMQDLNLRAKWEQTYLMASNPNLLTISETASVLDFGGCGSNVSLNREYTFTRTVDAITLRNIDNLSNLNFNIDNGRGRRIRLIFDNVNFIGKPDWPAIKALSVDLDIYVKTSSTVQGGKSHMPIHNITFEEFVYMPSAITCNKMSVYPYSEENDYPTITFIGGSGENGNPGSSGNSSYNSDGTNGTRGGDGCMGAYGIFCAGIKVYAKAYLIARGGDGGNGGNGGAGGDGGAVPNVGNGVVGNTGKDGGCGGCGGTGGDGASGATIFGTLEIKSQGKAEFTPGRGGNGGAGGKGGNGGQGGKGGDGKFGVHAARGGRGGDGGDGGWGGYGGKSEDNGVLYVLLTNNGTLYNNIGTAGDGGAGGQGGTRGAGGAGGKKWPTNKPAESGSPGDAGSPGQPGSNGSLT